MRTAGLVFGMAFTLLASNAAADQPHMQRALDHLQRAHAALEQAKANKGGHRDKALEHVGEAQREVRSGMAVAQRDGDGKDRKKD